MKTILNKVIYNDFTFHDVIYEDFQKVVVKNEVCRISFVNCVFQKTLDLRAIFEGVPNSIYFHKCNFLSTIDGKAISVIVNIDIPHITFGNCFVEDLNIEKCQIKHFELYNTFTSSLITHTGYKIDLFKITFDFNLIESMFDSYNSSHLDVFFQKQNAVLYIISKGYDLFEFSMNKFIDSNAKEYEYFKSLGDNSMSRLNIRLGITGGSSIQTNEKVRINNSTLRSLNFKEKFNDIEVRGIRTNVFGLENFQANTGLFYQINHSEFNHTKIVKNFIYQKQLEINEIVNRIKSNSLGEEERKRYESQKHKDESKIKELKGVSIFNINKSDLKNCSFWHIDFNGFERINFFNTNIEDGKFSMVKLSEVIFSSSENIYNDQWYNHNIDFKEEYDIYRQFASVFSKNGDIYNSLKAKSFQMKALLKFDDLDCKIKLILNINRITNDFGNSASRAFFWIIIAAVIFYCLFMGTMYSFNLTDNGWKYFVQHFKYIFSLILNPFSTTSKMDELKFANNWTYAVVFASKIVMAFLYYQFVAAYRRFGKSEK